MQGLSRVLGLEIFTCSDALNTKGKLNLLAAISCLSATAHKMGVQQTAQAPLVKLIHPCMHDQLAHGYGSLSCIFLLSAWLPRECCTPCG